MPPLGRTTLPQHHHELSPRQTAFPQPQQPLHPLLPPLGVPQTTITIAPSPLPTLDAQSPGILDARWADGRRNTLTSPFDRSAHATQPAHLTGVPAEIRVTAIELTVLVVFMVVLVVLLIWLFVMALDFALRYIRVRLEGEVERRERRGEGGGDVDADMDEGDLEIGGGDVVGERTGLLKSASWKGGRGRRGKMVSWKVEQGRVRKLEREIERRIKEEDAREWEREKGRSSAMVDVEANPRRRSTMEVGVDGTPRRQSAE